MREEPVIEITEPKVTHKALSADSLGMIDEYDYSESHIIYKGIDLGSFEELNKRKRLMDDCYICKELKEKGYYEHIHGYVEIQISKDENGQYRCYALGESTSSIPCNYCPHCGRRLEGEDDGERKDS